MRIFYEILDSESLTRWFVGALGAREHRGCQSVIVSPISLSAKRLNMSQGLGQGEPVRFHVGGCDRPHVGGGLRWGWLCIV